MRLRPDATGGFYSRQVFFPYLHGKSCVRIDVGQRKEVRGPDKEVAVECVRGEATRAADPHHGLESDLSRQVAPKIALFWGLFLSLLLLFSYLSALSNLAATAVLRT